MVNWRSATQRVSLSAQEWFAEGDGTNIQGLMVTASRMPVK